LRKDINRYHEELNHLSTMVHQLRIDSDLMKSNLDVYRSALETKRLELDATQMDLAHYKNLFNTIEQSRSWKITRPLRVLGQAMKKAKQTIRRF